MVVNLSGDYPADQLEDYAEELQDRIEDLQQINEAEIRGVNKKEMEVEVDYLKASPLRQLQRHRPGHRPGERLHLRGRHPDGWTAAHRPGGRGLPQCRRARGHHRQGRRRQARLPPRCGHRPVRRPEATSFAREWGNPVVSLDVRKRLRERIFIIASDEINRIIAEAKAEFLPADLNVSITSDQSDQTRTQVDELQNSIILGVLLVVGALLFFLGLRNALLQGSRSRSRCSSASPSSAPPASPST